MAALLAIVVAASTVSSFVRTETGARAGPTTPRPTAPATLHPAQSPPPPGQWSAPASGSLSDPATAAACDLLTRNEIARHFGGSIGEPTPMYPYCRWAVGGGFLALRVAPHTSVPELARGTPHAQSTSGLGPGAFFGTNRFLYFGTNRASYWLLWQHPAEFTGVRSKQLVALARIVRSRSLSDGLISRPHLASPPMASGPPAPIPAPTRGDPLTVWFAGDSLSAGPSWAFGLRTKELGVVRTLAEYQVGTGLVRDDYWDWYRHSAAAMAALDPEVAVFMAGGNDGQPIRVNGSYARVGTPTWSKEYARRVGATMDVLAAGGRRVVWIGMPPMRDPGLNASARRVNDIFRRQAAWRPAVTYVDAYAMFAGPRGAYTDRIGGGVVRLTDGVHLNVAGSELLATRVLRVIGTFVQLPAAG
jgi:hypothetical protein